MKKETTQTKYAGIEKVVLSSGLGKMRLNNAQFEDKVLPEIMGELASIVGQKPKINRARKSIAGFKVRQKDVVGMTATLRGRRKNDFLTIFTNNVLPRVRDFRGISVSHVDKDGNLSIGLKDQLIFPQINPEKSNYNFGIEITIVTKTKNRDEAVELYRNIGIPLVDNK